MKLIDFNILVEEDSSVDKLTIGGLELAKGFTIPMAYGRVLQVGPGRINKKFNKRVNIDLKVGDIIVYNPGVGKPINASIKNADGTVTKRSVTKLRAVEAAFILDEVDGKICNIKSVRENYIIVKRDDTDNKSAGGIIIPNQKRTIDTVTGTVIMTGPGKYDPETDSRNSCFAKVGDKITFTEMQSIQLTIPMTNENGEVVKTKLYQIPDTWVEVILDTDKDGFMNGVKQIKNGHLLVKRDNNKRSAAGIYLPDTNTMGHMIEAEVIALGGELISDVKVGDRIAYIDERDNNKEFKLPIKQSDGTMKTEKCYLLPETEIEVIFDENEGL